MHFSNCWVQTVGTAPVVALGQPASSATLSKAPAAHLRMALTGCTLAFSAAELNRIKGHRSGRRRGSVRERVRGRWRVDASSSAGGLAGDGRAERPIE